MYLYAWTTARERPFTGASGRLITRVERALERQETLQIVQKMIYYITLYLSAEKNNKYS